jgi:hypothetical protein
LFATTHDHTVLTVRPGLPARASAVVGRSVVEGYHTEEAEKVLAITSKLIANY